MQNDNAQKCDGAWFLEKNLSPENDGKTVLWDFLGISSLVISDILHKDGY